MRWGRDGFNRGTAYSRQGELVWPVNMSSYLDSFSDQAAWLRIGGNLASYFDTQSDVYASIPLTLAAYADSGTDLSARLSAVWEAESEIVTTTNIYAGFELTQLLGARIDTTTDIYAKYRIPHLLSSQIDTAADIYAVLRAIDSWTFTFSGTLAAGKTLCIDKNDFTVKNDGANAMVGFTGDFPAMLPGENTVVYTDALGSRTVTIVVSKKDRSI